MYGCGLSVCSYVMRYYSPVGLALRIAWSDVSWSPLLYLATMAAPTDRTPLLPVDDMPPSEAADIPPLKRAATFIKGVGEPSWIESYKFLIFGSWWNVLLLAIPFSFVSHYQNWDAALRFSFSFVAILPLAKVHAILHRIAHIIFIFRAHSCLVMQQTRCQCRSVIRWPVS